MSSERPFQTLEDRLTGRPAGHTLLHSEVTDWLDTPLREWLMDVLTNEVARRVALRLRMARPLTASYFSTLVTAAQEDLLKIVDATLQLHPGWDETPEFVWGITAPLTPFQGQLLDLDQILTDANSGYRVDGSTRCLVRRVKETVQQAADATLKTVPATAADHLQKAWVAAYGLDPEPDKVFNEAIRAVEEVACPLVEPRKAAAGKATLGTVIGELRNSGHRWELALPGTDGQPRSVESLVGQMETLWQAQRSRHGGGTNSRRQTQEEAEAAVHLAVLLVQWLTSGVLRKS